MLNVESLPSLQITIQNKKLWNFFKINTAHFEFSTLKDPTGSVLLFNFLLDKVIIINSDVYLFHLNFFLLHFITTDAINGE